jgi:predicted ATPase
MPFTNAMQAKALIALDRFDQAAGLLEEARAMIDKTGHRMHEAEVYRVLGELHQARLPPDVRSAEIAYRKALEVAQHQEAKGWELRTATSLARLWRGQGKSREAYDLLAPIYNWFTEGFDTRDLWEAKALLDDLQA